MTDTDKAYIAGFVDGEGCITLVPFRAKSKYPCWCPVVKVTNTNRAILTFIQKAFGGKIYTTSHKNKKDCNVLHLANDKARDMLKNLLPFLRVKVEQAKLLINYPKRQSISLGRGRGGLPDIEGYKKQLAVYTQVRKLNKRGVLI